MRRRAVQGLALMLAVLLIMFSSIYVYLRQSLPALDGTIQVSGLEAPVEIVRDADAVPHIFAKSKLDALFGLGYVHAQDRLWQMEFQRRIGYGRLSEIFGAVAVPQDRFLRTVGFARAAQSAWDRLPENARRQVNAYTSGINALLDTHHGRTLPPEFTLLRFEPQPWTGPDVLVWAKMMAWDLSTNYSSELMRDDLIKRIGIDRTLQLMPALADDRLTILGAGNKGMPWPSVAQPGTSTASRTAAPTAQRNVRSPFTAFATMLANTPGGDLALGGTLSEGLGSNNWVVGGELTASGKPLLANDPHLAAHIPSIWYLAHLTAADFDVTGATLPGTPAVAIGRNRFIAWGATNVGADVEDLYREHLDESGTKVEFRGAFEPLQILADTIRVKGGADVPLRVRVSRHGPLISDAINASNAASSAPDKPAPLDPLALRWTALDDEDSTIECFLNLNEARNWSEFTGALRQLSTPSQNFVFADVAGHIGYYAPGHIPIRAKGDGLLPADGWSGDAEWTGWVPFDELPHTYDPPEHFVVTANNRPAAPSYPHVISNEFPEPYRAERITELIRTHQRLTPENFERFQADTLSLHARTLVPLLLARVHPAPGADSDAVELLRRWDFDASGASPAAAIFEAWFLQLAPAITGDDLGPTALAAYQRRFSYLTRFLVRTLSSGDSRWCDDVRTDRVETCEEVVTAALHEALARLRPRLGDEVTHGRWDAVHPAVFPHQGLDAVGLLRPLLSRSMPHGGDWSTVNVGATDADHPYEQHDVSSYREIVDLSPSNASLFADAVGQSGHFLSPHYADFLPDWAAVRYRRMRMDRTDIDRGAIGRLVLAPLTRP